MSENYDKSLAVKCINGTFVGAKTDNIISFKGIPFVAAQPVGELRWKAPVEYTPDNGVYEASHFANLSVQDASISDHQGEDCLYLNVWKADGAPDYADMNNQEMLEGAQGEYLLHASAYADAQVFPDRGVVVTHAQGEEMTEEKASVASSFFGPDGRHGEDYVLFYNNIKENVAKRVAAYLQGKKVHSS